MKYEHYKIVDVAIGGVNKRNNPMNILDAYAKATGKEECYHTVYRYTNEFCEHVKSTKSVARYPGYCYCDAFPIDIDSETKDSVEKNIASSIEKLLKLKNYLHEMFDFSLAKSSRLYFSGCKGFHVLIPSEIFGGWLPSAELPLIHKELAKRLLIEDEYDPAIYDKVRLFRMVNTKHGKSGLFKIQIAWPDLDNMADILEKAKKPGEPLSGLVIEENAGLTELFRSIETDKKSGQKKEQAAYFQETKPGNRTHQMTSMIGKLMKLGTPIEDALIIIRNWNEKYCNPPHDEEKVTTTVLSLYKQYAEKQMPEETDSDTEKIISKFYNMKQAGERYKEFAQKTKGKLITIGIPEVDKAIRGIYPGQVFGLMARAKTFKSAFMQNVAHRCAKQQRNVLIFSLEMPVISLFERSAQMEMDQSGDQIYSVFAGTSNSDFFSSDEIIDYVYKNAKGLYIVDQSRMSPKMMKDYIVVSEQELLNGERWDLIIVDFLQRVKEQGKSRIEVVGNIARNMKDLARDVDLPFIILIQISRSADKKEDGKERLNIASARDSGEIEEGVDYLAGMYRDNLSPNHIHFQLLANRQMKCEINPNPNDPNKDEIMLEISFPSLRMQTIWGNVEQGEKKVEVKVEKEKAHIPEEEYSDDDNDPVPF